MLFNSYAFLFLFLPITLLGYFILQKAGKGSWNDGRYISVGNAFLLAASFVFYGWNRPAYIPVLVSSMAVNYGLFRQMEKARHKKRALAAGLAFNLTVLACFKYIGTGAFVPLGISFFTFTQIAFLMEGYRGNLGQVKALSYGLYVGFFPKVMQGPIALPDEILPQLEKAEKKVDWERIYRCLYLFTLGLFKKVLLADTLGGAVDFGYANLGALNSADAVIVMLSYTLQLYFDFSGYCDMAMGIAGMFGIELPLNFNSPYKASNIMEFWQGWHITLTRFFTRYLYIPLGGNRKGKYRTYINCLIVFFISGIWHGAGWQFIIWGLMHGILYVAVRAWKDSHAGKKNQNHSKNKIFHAISVLFTFLYVNIAWIFFRAPSVKEALELIKTICSFRFTRINWDLAGCFNLDEFWYIIKVAGIDNWQYAHYILMAVILLAMLILVFFCKNAFDMAKRVKPGVLPTIFIVVLFVWSVLSLSGVSSFLYVNF